MAESKEFGQIVSDILGNMGLREAAKKAGISAAYMGNMKDGIIPSVAVLTKFAANYELSGELARRYWEAAESEKPKINLEQVLQFACDAAGMDTMSRWRVLEVFREQSNKQIPNSAA